MVIGLMYDIVFQETHKSKKKNGNGKFLFGSLHSFMTKTHTRTFWIIWSHMNLLIKQNKIGFNPTVPGFFLHFSLEPSYGKVGKMEGIGMGIG